MNIDERLDRLAQTVDLFVNETRANTEAQRVNVESLHSSVAELFEMSRATNEKIDKLTDDVSTLTSHMTKLTVTVDRMANIIIRHDERLDSLDGG